MRNHRSVLLAGFSMFLLLVGTFTLTKRAVQFSNASSTGMVWWTSLWPMPEDLIDPIPAEGFGESVAVGDVNGDGFDDVIVCSDFGVRVYEGPVPAQDGLVWADPMLKIDVHSYSIYERDVAVADVNNDTIMDIIIGFARPAPAYHYNGWIAAFYGRTEWTTSLDPLEFFVDDADWLTGSPSNWPSGSGGCSFGSSVANAGDANADGIDDIIVGAPYNGPYDPYAPPLSKAYVFYGSTTDPTGPYEIIDSAEYRYTYPPPPREVHEFRVDSLGYEVAKGGRCYGGDSVFDTQIIGCPSASIDLNDDGYYTGNEGAIGAAITTPPTQIFLPGEALGPYSDYKGFGYALGNAGDVNGDGLPEVIVCAFGRYSWIQPKVFLYLGEDEYGYAFRSVYDWSVESIPYNPGTWTYGYHYTSVGSAGDINGDGYGDIFVGDITYNPDSTFGMDGRVHIWLGGPPSSGDPSGLGQSETPETADIILDPSVVSPFPISCVSFGYSVASGDINGDGLSDIVVGDPSCFHPYGGTDPGVQSGAVHVFLSGFSPPGMPWDITGPTMWVPDGKCDMRDVALVGSKFGALEGDGRYDVRADITGPSYLVADGKIDMRDVGLTAKHYGEIY